MSRLSSSLAPAASVACLCTLMWACVQGGGSSVEDGDDDGSGGAGATGGTTSQGGGDGGFVSVGGSSQGGGATTEYEVYGHGPNELYRLDPQNNNFISEVGPFTGCDSGILDIAIDKDNNIIGVSAMGLWSISRTTGACTQIATGDFPNSLSFVPAGTLDASVEALVGYKEQEYLRYDPTTGMETVVNATALVAPMESSGDVVSIDGGNDGNRTFLTVRGTPQCTDSDCLIEIDPTTGVMMQNYGTVGYDDVFGLAFWGGSAYGFTRGGDVFEITFNGSTVSSTAVPLQGLSVEEFWGAGSSTLVPLLPPQ